MTPSTLEAFQYDHFYDPIYTVFHLPPHDQELEIEPLLTPEQQIKADAEDAGLTAKTSGGGGKSGSKKAAAAATEDSVLAAIQQYDALNQTERDTMIAKIKEAAARPAPAPAGPQ